MHVGAFFENHNKNFLVKSEHHKPFHIERANAEYIRLGGEFSGMVLEPLLVTIQPGKTHSAVFSHPGEEFFYVLWGAVIFNVDGQEYLVKKGDSIHFPSKLPHFWINPLEQEAKILCVLTPAIFK